MGRLVPVILLGEITLYYSYGVLWHYQPLEQEDCRNKYNELYRKSPISSGRLQSFLSILHHQKAPGYQGV